ncbi:MAG: hypothetical protein GC181_00905 [Bacteroidetes bacterium]|nr:hypothetical protein [Bacteroidota bacterium]
MKALKVIGILLLVIVALALIASLVLPKEIAVSESVTINAPIDLVWKKVGSWEESNKWSPWMKLDSAMEITYEGEPGAVGSKFSWTGNDKAGSGSQVIDETDAENHTLKSTVNFIKPMSGTANVEIMLADEGEGNTKVTWTMNQKMSIPFNMFAAVFGAKKMVSKTYVDGLAALKSQAEEELKNIPTEPEMKVEIIDRPATDYVGKRETINTKEVGMKYGEQIGMLMAACGKENIAIAGSPAALYFTWDTVNQKSEMAAVALVEGNKAPAGYSIINVPGGRFASMLYTGPYEGIGAAHDMIMKYIADNKLSYVENAPVIETYITGPPTETDPAKYVTRIDYPIQDNTEN